MWHCFRRPNFGRLEMQVMDIFLPGLSDILVKGNVAHVLAKFRVRIMVRSCFVLVFACADAFSFMKLLDFSENDWAKEI